MSLSTLDSPAVCEFRGSQAVAGTASACTSAKQRRGMPSRSGPRFVTDERRTLAWLGSGQAQESMDVSMLSHPS
jgi:hypothetical protein